MHAPGIRVDVTASSRQPALDLLESGAADVALGYFDNLPNQFATEFLFAD